MFILLFIRNIPLTQPLSDLISLNISDHCSYSSSAIINFSKSCSVKVVVTSLKTGIKDFGYFSLKYK